jgi:uncharacterized protein
MVDQTDTILQDIQRRQVLLSGGDPSRCGGAVMCVLTQRRVGRECLPPGRMKRKRRWKMSEKVISLDSGGLQLEGLLEDRPGERGLVVTHPHPLYGGNMDNNVVMTLRNAYAEKDYSTLRFNFRGAGGSEGCYDNGAGEQEDLKAALDYLSNLGKKRIDIAGYSFGAWVIALGLYRFTTTVRVVMVSPPVDFLDFSSLQENPRIRLVIAGSRDDFGSPDQIKRMVSGWNRSAELRIIEGADHFYWDKTHEITAILREFLDKEN